MKATVDVDICVGCGLCVDTCPTVFAMDGDVAKVLTDKVPDDTEMECKDAADLCPVDAIRIEE